ncbi:MAG: DUF84 family protein [Candidatus Pacebacteria bacterium]|nr:DUF84 family protein [Candidatus Paceibacterota bacterium]
MYIFVGSTNPVKINAVTIAASEAWPEVKVQGLAVKSGVSNQPRSDQETKTGAINRAQAVFQQALASFKADLRVKLTTNNQFLGIGLEGGVFQYQSELWSTVWCAVIDGQKNLFTSNGARFKVPKEIAQPILAGQEMGPVVGKFFNDKNLKQKQGAIGVITNNFVDRTEEYTSIVKLTLELWAGRDWYQQLK